MIASLQETLALKPDDEKSMKEIERLKLKRMELINNPSLAISNGEKRVSKSSSRAKRISKDKDYPSTALDPASLSNASIAASQHDSSSTTSNMWHDYSNSPPLNLGMPSIFLPPPSLTLPPPNSTTSLHGHANPVGVTGSQTQLCYMYIYDQQPLMDPVSSTTHGNGHVQLNDKAFSGKQMTFPNVAEVTEESNPAARSENQPPQNPPDDNHGPSNGGKISQNVSETPQENPAPSEPQHLVSGWDYTLS